MPPPRPVTDTRKPYAGPTRSLVIAIDVGTTFSGVSYAILDPGEIPKIHGVTRFPGQEHVAGNTKIPSVIYYDRHGKMMAAGAEADTSAIQAQAEDDGWIKAELFKLRLRPRTMQLNMNGMRLGPLPKRKTAVHVFGDFLAYLYRCTRNFITDTHANGASLWNQVEGDLQFVLSHPNGWEGAQQSKMRRAAIYGGLIPETNEGKARIRFVTEGEASLHACVLNKLADDVMSNPSKHGFLIADAGGGTLDISSYAIKGTLPLVIEEIAPPDCIFAGSVFVSRRAREFLEGKLKNSRYGTPDALDHITRRFDETTKRLFRDHRDLQFIPFGSPLDKDPTVGIRGGQLKLTGQEVADLFEPSVSAAFKAIKAQIEASQGMIKSVFLVGGYAASPWLFTQLQERLAPFKITVSRPDTQTSKAVADGAIGFYCDHHVSARMSKFMYGVEFLREMDPRDQEHLDRKDRLCELPSGPKLLPDAFDCILARGVRVKESTVFTRKYCTELTSLSMLSVFEVEIWCYRGGNTIPKWIDRQADDFSTLCVVRADLSPLAGSAAPKTGKNKTYWTIVFSVEIQFGLTEFKARIKWVDNGMTKYGPASIIYNERGHRANEDEPDVFPEDEANTASASTTPRSATDRIRSEPASRARTPGPDTRQSSIPPSSTTSSRRPSQSYPRSELSYASVNGTPAHSGGGIPEVARLDRERSVASSKNGQSSPSIASSRNGHGERNDYESDRRTVSSSKSRDRERGDTPRATPRSTSSKIGDTLSSVWGAGTAGAGGAGGSGSQSGIPSPRHGATASPRPGSIAATGQKSPRVDPQQTQSLAPQTPSHHSTRSMSSQHHSQQKSPYVETISTTIEPPKNPSPWDSAPSPVPRSISRTSSQARVSEKDRMSSLWEDAPRSSYGDPPKTPWGGNLKTPSQAAHQLGAEESTVLLAATPAPSIPPEIPQTLSRSVSMKSANTQVPPDVDDAPPAPSGWGSATPKSITTPAPGGEAWDMGTPASAVTATPASTASKIPKRSRKGSVAASTLSSAKVASPAKSPFAVPDTVDPLTGPPAGSPNLLAGVPSLSGQVSPGKQPLSPLNPAAQQTPASTFGDIHPPATPGSGGFNWGAAGGGGANDNLNFDNTGVNESNPVDSWGFNDATQQQTGGDTWGGLDTARSLTQTLPPTDPTQTPGGKGTPRSLTSKTPKTPALDVKSPAVESVASPIVETPTPTTPAVEEPVMSAVGGKKKKTVKKGGSKGTSAAAAAAALAAEEEERRKEAEAEEERKRLQEEEEKAQAAKAAEEEAERQRAADAEAAAAEAKAEAERLAKEEEERLAKEEEERLAKEIADLEAEAARDKAEKERKEKDAKAAAAALADTSTKGGKKKKTKKGAALNLWEDEEEKERERMAKEVQEAEERAAKEKVEQEAKETAEQEAREHAGKAAEEAKLKAEQEAKQAEEDARAKQAEEEAKARQAEEDARVRAEQEAAAAFTPAIKGKKGKKKGQVLNMWDDAEDQEAKIKAEQEAKQAEEAQAKQAEEDAKARQAEEDAKAKQAEADAKAKAEEQEAAAAFTPAPKGKKGKKKGQVIDLWDDADTLAKEEEARVAREKAEEEAKEVERLAKEKADQEAREKEEKEKAEKEKEEKEKAGEGNAGEEAGSASLFGGWAPTTASTGGWGAISSWGNKVKSKTPSITSGLGNWGAPTFGGSFGSAFNTGNPEAQQEEFKLHDVSEPTKPTPSQSLFDDFSFAPPVTLDTTAFALDGPKELSRPGSKAPSRAQSKAPSRATSPAPPTNPTLPPDPVPAGPTEAVAEPVATPASEEPPAPEAASGEPPTANAEEEWGLPVKTKKKKGKRK